MGRMATILAVSVGSDETEMRECGRAAVAGQAAPSDSAGKASPQFPLRKLLAWLA